MYTPNDRASNDASFNTTLALAALGVPNNLLETQGIDFDLLYQRFRFAMNGGYFNPTLKCVASWQLTALAGLNNDYKKIDYTIKQFDNWGASPIHYVAWSGKKEALDWINTHHKGALLLKDKYEKTPIHYAAWSDNKEALDWINTHHKDALWLKNNSGATPIHFAAGSGKKEVLDWINTHHKDALLLNDNEGKTPIHFAAWSGKKEALDWINTHHKDALWLKDNEGKTPIHFAAASGKKEALDWIYTHHKDVLWLKDNYGAAPIHYAAWSGKKEALEWIYTNLKDALSLKDDNGATPIHYAARSGNKDALDWINVHHKDALSLKNNNGATPIHYAAWSGNHQTLNHAVALSKTPQSWALSKDFHGSIITNTLVEALKTNHTLTLLEFNGAIVDDASKLAIEASLSRNREIKQVKVKFIAFMQGLNQSDSIVSLLRFGELELCTEILSNLLPKDVPTTSIFNAIQSDANLQSRRALVLVNEEINRLETTYQQKINFLYSSTGSRTKLGSMLALREIIQNNPNDWIEQMKQWEKANQEALATKKTFSHTQKTVLDIKQLLGLEEKQQLGCSAGEDKAEADSVVLV